MSAADRGQRRLPLGRLIIALQALVAVAFVGYLLQGDKVRVPLLSDTETIEVAFVDAGGLNSEDRHPVTIAGVRVGEVTDVRYADRRAVATLTVDPGTRDRLRRDATVVVQPRSALQDNTVELVPGSASAPLGQGQRLAADHRAAPVGLDQVLSTLDADTRAQLQILLGQLDTGLTKGATPLRRALRELGPAMTSTSRVARALNDRSRQLARLVTELDQVFGTLADRRAALRTVLAAGERTVAVTGARERELAQTIRALPGALAAVDTALTQTRVLADPLVPALDGLRPSARRLPRALSAVRDLVPSARGLLADLEPVARDGRAPARSLRDALTSLRPAASGLTPSVERLTPVLRDIDDNKTGIGLLGARFSGVFSTSDANGQILRGLGFFEAFDPAGFGEAGASGARLRALKLDAVRALAKACGTNAVACLVRYLIPGLPGSLRSADAPAGDAQGARRRAGRLLSDVGRARRAGLAPRDGRDAP